MVFQNLRPSGSGWRDASWRADYCRTNAGFVGGPKPHHRLLAFAPLVIQSRGPFAHYTQYSYFNQLWPPLLQVARPGIGEHGRHIVSTRLQSSLQSSLNLTTEKWTCPAPVSEQDHGVLVPAGTRNPQLRLTGKRNPPANRLIPTSSAAAGGPQSMIINLSTAVACRSS